MRIPFYSRAHFTTSDTRPLSLDPGKWGRPHEVDKYEGSSYLYFHEKPTKAFFQDRREKHTSRGEWEFLGLTVDPSPQPDMLTTYPGRYKYQGNLTYRLRNNWGEFWFMMLQNLPELLSLEQSRTCIGSGITGKVYSFPLAGYHPPEIDKWGTYKRRKGGNESIFQIGVEDCIVKVIPKQNPQRRKPGSFQQEVTILQHHPDSPLIAIVSDDRNVYLIAKPIPGKFIHPETNPLTAQHLKNIMQELKKLDAWQIFDYDLHFSGNILVTEANATIIDFDWCEYGAKTMRKKSRNEFLPTFVTPSNLFVFESHALFGSYFFDNLKKGLANGHSTMTNTQMRKTFTETLRQSTAVHIAPDNWLRKRPRLATHWPHQIFSRQAEQDWVKGHTKNQLKTDAGYGHALYEILQKPTAEVVNLEASRVQVRFDDERDFFATEVHQQGLQEHLWWRWNVWQHAKRYMKQTQDLAVNIRNNPQHRKNPYWKTYLKNHQKLSAHYGNLAARKLQEAIGKTGENPIAWSEIESGQVADIRELFERLHPSGPPPTDNPDHYDIAAMIQQAG